MVENILAVIEEYQDRDIPIIVEGRKDKESLQKLGFENIIVLYSKPFFKIIEQLSSEVVILTDLDQEGRRLYRKILHECMQRGVKVDNQLRELLFKETNLGQIQGLWRYLQKRIPPVL